MLIIGDKLEKFSSKMEAIKTQILELKSANFSADTLNNRLDTAVKM